MHAVEWGSRRSGRVVVCVHGYSGNSRDFDFLARELSTEARVVCPDVAGRGQSAWLPSPLAYHFPQFVADLRRLVGELGASRVDWVGTSMGGLLGMLLAAQPDSPIERLVLNDVGAFVPGDALAAIARNLRAPARFDSMAAVEAHVRHTHREWGPVTDEQWSHLARHAARRLPDGYAMHYDPRIAQILQPAPFAPGLSLWSAWYRVRCPVLVVRGETSRILPAEVVRAMLDINPHAQCIEIADTGHAPSLMAPQQVAAVARFLGETVVERQRKAA
ncbi:MAG TPA: alpha/beta hydrolase [Usitatibacter sp.]|nr:alpha/beta hydrolase [Usitatibacter sp.]